MRPKPATDVMDAMRRPKRSATTAKHERPDRTPKQGRDEHKRCEDRLFTGIELLRLEIEKDGRQHHRRQVDVEHIDEFGEDGAADGSATFLLPVCGLGDKPRR